MKKMLLPFLFFLVHFSVLAQQGNEAIPELDSIRKLHVQKKITDTAFMESFIRMAKHQYYFNPLFNSFLDYYQSVAFKTSKYYRYKSQYYKFKSNIASNKGIDGARVYYAEKIDEELKKGPDYIPTLSSLMIQMNLYANWSMPKEGIEKCKHIWPFLDSLPLLIQTKKIPYSTVHNALYICIHSQKLFYLGRDTPHADRNVILAKKIRDAAVKRTDLYPPDNIGLFNFCIANIEYQTALFIKNPKQTEASLKDMLAQATAAQAKNFVWGASWVIESNMFLVKHYIEQKKQDSATKYMELAKSFYDPGDANWNQNENILLDRSEIDFLNGNYKGAYEKMKRAYKIKDSIIDLRLSDISNNMFAQTQAEFANKELEKARLEKEQRTRIITGIVLALLCGILYLYLTMRKKERQSKQNIDNLHTASNLQIAILEEQSRLAKLEEKERLGIELHDDLASTIALVRMSMDNEIARVNDPGLKQRLTELNTLVRDAYTRTRGKSHSLYHNSNLETEDSFRERIASLMKNGLPGDGFKREINIEESSLKNTSLETKIEFLYIIQEAITNIIKHAKATAVDIFIYKDETSLVLEINDNGRGFDISKHSGGIGVQSIIQRAKKINGIATFESDKSGTVVKVTI